MTEPPHWAPWVEILAGGAFVVLGLWMLDQLLARGAPLKEKGYAYAMMGMGVLLAAAGGLRFLGVSFALGT